MGVKGYLIKGVLVLAGLFSAFQGYGSMRDYNNQIRANCIDNAGVGRAEALREELLGISSEDISSKGIGRTISMSEELKDLYDNPEIVNKMKENDSYRDESDNRRNTLLFPGLAGIVLGLVAPPGKRQKIRTSD